ncbi:PREDICTED: ESF1 homolog isoform X1 [Rhinopithecus bieti]|uniref:ESF1 nucleolar pre-rRNA processing protein homolog n=1 Tax=Rhinopithecus bieti TaxID=61621 RepID=A0AAJ7H9F0_RHIBE|nr:PREDICTED: ESF1 homolog isoform X1 [Rhinopithecus bieti]XP_017724825.1 PREDICTED: ESF1 homolog isoform X1 [Rhinopithecus bieti]XP_017724831.1 PREDICTED: ESF1 homolog isoform X1 [Rhinopithecus bieti]XP_017724838.1 PREDICTED: ESF1 homolog isoform X1 [Rhinopithecus bieti]XP_017724844.1 PREDICTED: ESF1 homolog isoform X1 [Rhinopithecus bieti]XP_017724852.1 PREDICTED: ESF1 homolog isoform X1 [Rhinopithecus bieti]
MSSKQEIMNDQRFRRVAKDPRFWEMPEKDRKVKIDKRFRAMFHDKKFKLNYAVDKRGRPINHSTTEDLKRFYDLSDSDSDLSEEDSKASNQKKIKKKKTQTNKEIDSKNLVEKKKKETKKANQKGSKNKTDLDNSERIKKMKTSCKFKVDSNISAKKDSKEFTQKSAKEKKNIVQRTTDSSLKEKRRTLDSGTSEIVKSSRTKRSKTRGEMQSVVPPIMTRDSDGYENSTDVEMFDKDALEEDSESVSGSDVESESEITGVGRASGDDDDGSEDEEDEDEKDEDEDSEDDDESDSGPDLARGKGNIETSSEDEDDMADLFPEESGFEHAWRELDKDAPRADEITRRLAVCNMDWDRLKAKDLLALFNSFKPKGGVIFSIKIYPSEFGKERMKEEQVQGPVELLSIPEDAPEKDWTSREKLRDYQFKRLKYYYAVVDCDSPETASKIYEDCDGLEFESSCSFIDLRFIPDDITFDDEPKDVASEVDLTAYKPKYFTSAAMGTSTVEITWDETDHERITVLNRKFKKEELLDMDFQAYLASSSEDEEEIEEELQGDDGVDVEEDGKTKKSQKDDEEQIAKYRQLLQVIQEKEKKGKENDMEMEIKWVPGLKESAEEMVKNKLEGKDKLTPWEQFLEKKKEKKRLKRKQKALAEEASEEELPSDVDLNDPYFAEEVKKIGIKKKSVKSAKDGTSPEEKTEVERQKAEMALLMMDEDEDSKKHFNYNKIVEHQNLSKKKKKQLMKKKELIEDDFEVNVSDARFQAMYTSHLFNLDPSDPNFKKTKAMEKILEEKARQREQKEQELTQAIKKKESEIEKESQRKSIDPALSMLIKSIKTKTEQFQARKKQKVK